MLDRLHVVNRVGKRVGHVFISYVREDARDVDALQRALETAGIRVWRDTADLWPGEDWHVKIRHAISDDALVFIACFSQASLARPKSYQNEELVLAIEQLRQRRPHEPWLIPVRFDDCDIPDRDIGGGRTLKSIQRADLFGADANVNVARLVATVQRILDQLVRFDDTEISGLVGSPSRPKRVTGAAEPLEKRSASEDSRNVIDSGGSGADFQVVPQYARTFRASGTTAAATQDRSRVARAAAIVAATR